MPLIIVLIIVICIVISFFNPDAGKSILKNFLENSWFMVSILPLVFILIGLFDVWVTRDKIENTLARKAEFPAIFGFYY